MRFLIDNNLPPPLAKALHELSLKEQVEVFHLRQKFPGSTPDIEWITRLSGEGDWAVVSKDRFRKGNAEKAALKRSGLTVFYLNKSWSSQKYWSVAQRLVHWWPSIIEQASGIEDGAAFEVPWNSASKGRFRKIQL